VHISLILVGALVTGRRRVGCYMWGMVTSVLGHFGPRSFRSSKKGPKWPRTEVDVDPICK